MSSDAIENLCKAIRYKYMNSVLSVRWQIYENAKKEVSKLGLDEEECDELMKRIANILNI